MKNDSLSARRMQAKYLLASDNGVGLVGARPMTFKGGNMGKRGKVQGFSRASARRFRHLLFRVDYRDAVAVTLTHPLVMSNMRGPEWAFQELQKHSSSLPLRALIWRKEVQAVGTPHYHCIAFPSEGVAPADAAKHLVDAWIHQCTLGLDAPTPFREQMAGEMRKAHRITKGKKSSIKILDGSRYVRYVLDHESKHKQEQARTTGRPWGVWNRDHLPFAFPDRVELTEADYWLAARLLRKATRYAVKAECPFGWRHTSGRRAHGVGRVEYFALANDGRLARQVLEALAAMRKPLKHEALDGAGRFFRAQFALAPGAL